MGYDVKKEVTDKYSLRGRVFSKLREDILSGKYEENEELKEVAIGEELGVSRTPVREAFRQLELEGLIQIIPNKGAYVTGITEKDVKDMKSWVDQEYADGRVTVMTDSEIVAQVNKICLEKGYKIGE